MSRSTLPPDWLDLLHGMADDVLTEDQTRQLAGLLRNDVEFRREYVCFCQLLTQLGWQFSPASVGSRPEVPALAEALPATPTPRVRPVRNPLTRQIMAGNPVWIATAVLVICALVWLGWTSVAKHRPAQVVRVSGPVAIVRGQQAPLHIHSHDLERTPWHVQPGDRIQTGRGSSATLLLSDQTEIRIRPESEFVLDPASPGRLALSHGSLSARVTRQTGGRALTFVLPNSEVRVLGTELELLALPRRSEVAVLEGRVRVIRSTDQTAAEIIAAQHVSIPESGPLLVRDWPLPPDEWSEDFEHGLPAGWTGRAQRGALPSGSQGAVAAAPGQLIRDLDLEISSPPGRSGLFAWHDDSVLHLTFRVQPPGWFHIYLLAGTYEQPDAAVPYCFVNPILWQSSAGQWRTVSIPLSEFRPLTAVQGEPTLGRIPVRLAICGKRDMADVLIDRIWVDRPGPDSQLEFASTLQRNKGDK